MWGLYIFISDDISLIPSPDGFPITGFGEALEMYQGLTSLAERCARPIQGLRSVGDGGAVIAGHGKRKLIQIQDVVDDDH